ncbi:hypothetical protein GLOIN_2v992638 [Rhizophagus irregularis DAOM 181602=DAOM 197198]|uniref:Uncharacterized protein n=1 Tax=Rhizophagus irregularis (strain DAOM 181602 / DAOM 197198 / MUCL 43194) TaxID=747089 RepID=A0A2P4QC47_RHIID|nr:hypothetical protein GLOIN_2v992638 [Rhizophagus irregularis DAOM 181602=DAOM 197198]POG75218.1 hypothetical protein GLOIN_2v992638 [Rhizophagus irregularis DAOM 181602=DAOM 197198]GBC50647.2 hypothetical protein GLOIN_2v992638 [Rhizophagus irregularis DAOM 181602=DAOM 197198]|eukprot:XP_025182084.1 hypothetical protein GLOIN_2v992638 [Rhizophagus irregularis DAOM 181602=DAOM 197198]
MNNGPQNLYLIEILINTMTAKFVFLLWNHKVSLSPFPFPSFFLLFPLLFKRKVKITHKKNQKSFFRRLF